MVDTHVSHLEGYPPSYSFVECTPINWKSPIGLCTCHALACARRDNLLPRVDYEREYIQQHTQSVVLLHYLYCGRVV